MVEHIVFGTDSDLVAGLRKLLNELEKRIALREPIKMFIAGGMAVHLYTQARVTTDVDAEFSKRIHLPLDLLIETEDGNMLYFDPTYNSAFALMHEDYLDDAIKTPLGTEHIEVYALSPIVGWLRRQCGRPSHEPSGCVGNGAQAPFPLTRRRQQALRRRRLQRFQAQDVVVGQWRGAGQAGGAELLQAVGHARRLRR